MEAETGQGFLTHLAELRDRLLRSLLCVLVIFLCLTFFSGKLYTLIATPLVNQFDPGSQMIATEVASTFIAPLKLVFYLSVFLSMPFLLYHAWSFIAPGLYRNERRLVLPMLIISIVLFYLGMAFAYFIIFPIVFGFFIAMAPEGVTVMTDITHYLDFIMKLLLAFGLAFEVPVVTLLLILSRTISVTTLRKKRPYVIVGAFILGMLLTPPDVMSQVLLAVPVWLLFELGLVMGACIKPDAENEETDQG